MDDRFRTRPLIRRTVEVPVDLAERWEAAATKTRRSRVSILREALDLWLMEFEHFEQQEEER